MNDREIASDEDTTVLLADERVLPLARILHYAKREAAAIKMTGTVRLIEQAIVSLLIYTNTPLGPPS